MRAFTAAEMNLSNNPVQEYCIWMEVIHVQIEMGFFCLCCVEIMSGK